MQLGVRKREGICHDDLYIYRSKFAREKSSNFLQKSPSLQVRPAPEEGNAGDLVPVVPGVPLVPVEPEAHPPPVPLQQTLAVAGKVGHPPHPVQDVGDVGRLLGQELLADLKCGQYLATVPFWE